MKMFFGWIKEGEEHRRVFEMCQLLRVGRDYLRGNWKIIRKVRFVRFMRKLIEEGIIVSGVKEIYEEGVRILREMEGGEVGEEEEEYMFELYLMKVRGIEKKMKEDEMEVLRRKLVETEGRLQEVTKRMEEEKNGREEEKRKREEAERRAEEEKKKVEEAEKKAEEERRRREEEKNRADEERRKREEAEAQMERMRREMEEMRKKISLPTQTPSATPPITPIASAVITSLDGTSVTFTPNNDGIMREGNTIINHGSDVLNRNCFIGGEMRSV